MLLIIVTMREEAMLTPGLGCFIRRMLTRYIVAVVMVMVVLVVVEVVVIVVIVAVAVAVVVVRVVLHSSKVYIIITIISQVFV